jgi:hypothetical protein
MCLEDREFQLCLSNVDFLPTQRTPGEHHGPRGATSWPAKSPEQSFSIAEANVSCLEFVGSSRCCPHAGVHSELAWSQASNRLVVSALPRVTRGGRTVAQAGSLWR